MAESESTELDLDDIVFAEDIPTIKRAGAGRQAGASKYTPLLDVISNRPGEAGRVLSVDTQSQATSRAAAIRSASLRHHLVQAEEGHFVVATRGGEDGFGVWVQYVEGPAESKGDDEDDESVEEAPRPKKKARKKVARKA